jgi:hypothetical protein
MLRRAIIALSTLMLTVTLSAPMLIALQQPPGGQTEFVPMKDVPPTESIPAAPLLIVGYSFIWLAAIFYMWTIWRRLNKVETEMHALERKMPR